MYGFIIPVWILLVIATFKSSLGNLACDQTTHKQDQMQCYWGKSVITRKQIYSVSCKESIVSAMTYEKEESQEIMQDALVPRLLDLHRLSNVHVWQQQPATLGKPVDVIIANDVSFQVLIIFFLQSLVLGPLIFVVHTYGHLNVRYSSVFTITRSSFTLKVLLR